MRRLLTARAWLWSSTCLGTLGFVGAAPAADLGTGYSALANGPLPAVSDVNGKLAAFAGSVGGQLAYGTSGSLAIPVGQRFGLQFDGMVGSAREALFYGVGGHAFWRDPSRGLIGLYGSYVGWDAMHSVGVASPINGVADITGGEVGKAAVEAEAYFGRVSLEGLLGYQFGTLSGVTGKATVAFYPIDTLRLDTGVRYLNGQGTTWTAGAEWQPHGRAMSLFATGAFGGNGSLQALGGIKLYGGAKDKSLIQRHREDDPVDDLPANFFETIGPNHCPPGTTYFSDGNRCLNEG
ncbi:hypothetical protein BH10PSE12_BH10PSE12_24530 [soil metagenome]